MAGSQVERRDGRSSDAGRGDGAQQDEIAGVLSRGRKDADVRSPAASAGRTRPALVWMHPGDGEGQGVTFVDEE